MANVVGPKGQLVIEKSVRDRLGIGQGSRAIQRVVADRLEIRFFPPTHHRSLAGCLSSFIAAGQTAPTEEDLDSAVRSAVAEEWRASEGRS